MTDYAGLKIRVKDFAKTDIWRAMLLVTDEQQARWGNQAVNQAKESAGAQDFYLGAVYAVNVLTKQLPGLVLGMIERKEAEAQEPEGVPGQDLNPPLKDGYGA